ncbi:MAG: sulfatase-like hydrolase/transferase [Pyrinomonadaceae bacterium]
MTDEALPSAEPTNGSAPAGARFRRFRRPLFFALIFFVIWIAVEAIVFGVSGEYLIVVKHIQRHEYARLVAYCALGIAALLVSFAFVWAAAASRWGYRVFYIILFAVAIAVEYGYEGVFHRFTQLVDAENAAFAADGMILADAVRLYTNPLALIPIVAFIVVLIPCRPTARRGWLVLASVLVVLIGFSAATAYFSHNLYYTTSLQAFYRTATEFPMSWKVGSIYQPPKSMFFTSTRTPITYRTATPPVNNIIFVVDESVRGDHLGIDGYARDTTPLLAKLSREGKLKNWGIASSGATCSIESNNLLLTGLKDLPDTSFDVYKLPTIFQYAKAAGYKNYYFDGQLSTVWNGKASDLDDYEWINAKNFTALPLYEVDHEIALRVRQIVASSTGNFIWINKRGTHKPYERAYPKDSNVWQPALYGADDTGFYGNVDHDQLVNSYDNALLYNMQSFFSPLVDPDIPDATVIVYTSDHGQTLGENGAVVSHCSTTRSEAVVPLFMIGSDQRMAAADTSYKAAHHNLFATLLDLMNVPDDARVYPYAPSLLKAHGVDSIPRSYFAGDLHSSALGQWYPFDQ